LDSTVSLSFYAMASFAKVGAAARNASVVPDDEEPPQARSPAAARNEQRMGTCLMVRMPSGVAAARHPGKEAG